MEITGFDEQIGIVKRGVKALKKASTFINKKTAFLPAPKIVAVKKMQSSVKPSQIRIAPSKKIAVNKSIINKLVAAKKMQTVKSGSSVKPSQIRVARKSMISPVRATTPTKTVAVRKSELVKMIQAKKNATVMKPTQASPIVTAKQFKTFTSAPVTRPTMVTRPSAPVKVFSTDGSLKNITPSTFKKMSDVQRSFAQVDLPYQAVTPKTKVMRIKNSPVNLPININMIEPAVDAGAADYYGK
jgi:hypothetical protein